MSGVRIPRTCKQEQRSFTPRSALLSGSKKMLKFDLDLGSDLIDLMIPELMVSIYISFTCARETMA